MIWVAESVKTISWLTTLQPIWALPITLIKNISICFPLRQKISKLKPKGLLKWWFRTKGVVVERKTCSKSHTSQAYSILICLARYIIEMSVSFKHLNKNKRNTMITVQLIITIVYMLDQESNIKNRQSSLSKTNSINN